MTFSGSLLDPADRYRNDEKWLAARLNDSQSRFLPMWKLMAFVNGGDPLTMVWLGRSDIESQIPSALEVMPVFLGVSEDIAYFAVDVDSAGTEVAPLQGFGHFMEVRGAGARLAGGEIGIMSRARSMIDWHKRHGFCACCGQKSQIMRGGYMRQCVDNACAAQHFPRVDPVVIMLITRGDKCLLGRQSRFPEGMYSVLAGFMEPGETIEVAVRRESHEEAGIRVGVVNYIASQPWPFPSNLMIGCEAEALSEELTVDKTELEDAKWVTKSEVRRAILGDPGVSFTLPPPFSIARHLLEGWVSKK